MRYGNPSIASRLDDLVARGCERILIVPLYPQYAAATSATVCDEAFRALMKMRWQPAIRVAPPWHDDPVYIDAVASSLEAELARLPFKPDVVLASFHGIPKHYFLKGDPYFCHCSKTVRLLRDRLGVDDKKLMLTFQSRFGRAEWLQPYTDMTVKRLAKEGVKNIAVITPGFAVPPFEPGENKGVLRIETDKPDQPVVDVPATLFLPPRIEVLPAELTMAATPRVQQSEVTITNNGPSPIHMLEVTRSNEKIGTQFFPEPDGASYRLHLTFPMNYAPPVGGDKITIRTDDTQFKEIVIPIKPGGPQAVSQVPPVN